LKDVRIGLASFYTILLILLGIYNLSSCRFADRPELHSARTS
jgi:hypothetical protein